MEKSDKYMVHFISSMQDYLMYKEMCEQKDSEIKEYKEEKTKDPICDASESRILVKEENVVPRKSKHTSRLTLDEILEYIESMDPELIQDAKAIQLMLFKLIGNKCTAKEHKRICNVDRKLTRKKRTTINVKNGQYIESVKNQKVYGRRKNY